MKIALKVLAAILFIFMLVMGLMVGIRYTEAAGFILAIIGLIGLTFVLIFGKSKKSAKMKKGYSQLRLGMTVNEVIAILGTPTGRKIEQGKEKLIWRASEFKGMARGGTKQRSIIVDFENGRLVGYDSDNMGMSIL